MPPKCILLRYHGNSTPRLIGLGEILAQSIWVLMAVKPCEPKVRLLFWPGSELNNSAPDGDCHSLGAILGFQFLHDVLHVALDRVF